MRWNCLSHPKWDQIYTSQVHDEDPWATKTNLRSEWVFMKKWKGGGISASEGRREINMKDS